MTPLEMLKAFKTGCTNTMSGEAVDCRECVRGFLRALEKALTPAREARDSDLGLLAMPAFGFIEYYAITDKEIPPDLNRVAGVFGYLSYTDGNIEATLDGIFTASALRRIAKRMEKSQ